MSRRLPPLAWLRAFEAAARRLSFTAAAEELGVTQSAISQQIRSLEQQLQVALFLRKPRSLSLSEAGRKLLPQVEEGLRLLTDAVAAYPTTRAGPGERLTITCNSAFASGWLAPNLPDFLAQHPEMSVTITTAMWPDEYHMAVSDLEIRFLLAKGAEADMELLSGEAVMPVCSPALAATFDSPSALWRGARLIYSQNLSVGWSTWASRQGITEPPGQAGLSLVSFLLAFDLARTGNGVALGARLVAGDLLRSGELVPALPGPDLVLEEAYFLRLNQPQKPAAQAFRTWIMERLQPLDSA
ncbi:MAG: LysR family transcriptional regulator [Pseudomonadota bacterium]